MSNRLSWRKEFILERIKKNLFIVNVASYIGNTIIISGDTTICLVNSRDKCTTSKTNKSFSKFRVQ